MRQGLIKYFNLRGFGLWTDFFKKELMDPGFCQLLSDVAHHYAINDLKLCPRYPQWVFRAFHLTPLQHAKVIIIGQDPYPNQKQANGLAFSSEDETGPIPASLLNIFKELKEEELIDEIPTHANLVKWARQGVMLLNTTLTAEEGKAGIHKGQEGRSRLGLATRPCEHEGYGWEYFTRRAIEYAIKHDPSIILVAWGKDAKNLIDSLPGQKNVLSSVHPSPLSANKGFFGSNIFLKINALLKKQNKAEINWKI